MKRRGALMLLLSLVFGFGAAWAAKNWLEQRTPDSPAGTAVVVATMEIPFGTAIEARHVKVITVPQGTPLGNHFTSLAEIEGLVATQKALPDEVLLKERFTKSGAGSTLAALIRPDMRAMTVRVDDVVGVAGFLLPGNRVDVVAARKVQGSDRAITETILFDINVLAVDQTSSQDKNEPVVVRAVTLEMTPQQAEVLVRAREEGRIQLTLRNPSDDAQPQLVAEQPAPEPAPPPPPVRKVRQEPRRVEAPGVTIIRGTNVDAGAKST
jgi:pilus assembly protein CpaB